MGNRISIDEATARYQVSRRTLWRLHQKGLLPLYKEVGVRTTLVDAEELKRALASPRVTGPRRGYERTIADAPAD